MKGTGELFAMKRLKKTDILSKEQVRTLQLILKRYSGSSGYIERSGKTFFICPFAVRLCNADSYALNPTLTLIFAL